ncbi:hypothetical protein DSM19430T_09990 [Desulfovibrio psychrotolerans]|uniref:Uncharacterized protein n=1 Tax=Desulfovibrio psychrotolerans TaxID=415242 RepID=A0A7J0BT58_9BACT|nr:hypothetical protein DSM19430T_09990 [Desulfovibrio psychrotolerans]
MGVCLGSLVVGLSGQTYAALQKASDAHIRIIPRNGSLVKPLFGVGAYRGEAWPALPEVIESMPASMPHIVAQIVPGIVPGRMSVHMTKGMAKGMTRRTTGLLAGLMFG